jgi:hypothetical protein
MSYFKLFRFINFTHQLIIMSNSDQDKSTKGIGGTTLIGVGVGLAVVETSILMHIGTFIAVIGLGIVISAILTDTNI